MALYDIEALHKRILDILTAVDEMCKARNLTYYIWAGTMLGSIRHGGFIPWDDDIDIAMPRKDYDLLIANAAKWLAEPYEMVCAETDPGYPLPFAKIQDAGTTLIERLHLPYLGGVYIDVFPIDGVPQGWAKRWQFMRYEFYKRVLYLLHRDPYKHGKGVRSWLPLICRKLFSLQRVQKKIRRILVRYSFDDCKDVADYDDGMRYAMPKDILGMPSPRLFEGRNVMGVAQPDAYLTRKYGDYMTIPEENKRRQHNFHYLDLEHPYRNYKPETP